ncbi:ATP-binding cassette sub-family C member 4 [Ciona intestinalis]
MTKQEKLQKNPLNYKNIFSFISFWWMNGFFRNGSKHDLKDEDMYQLLSDDKSEKLCYDLECKWKAELQRFYSTGKKPSLFRAVVKTYFSTWLFYVFMGVIEEVLRTINPLLIRWLLRYFEVNTNVPVSSAYLYATGIFAILILLTFLHHVLYYYTQRLGWHLRAATCALMYKKTLRLSQKALAATTTGQIVNLGATDVIRFDWLGLFLHYLIIGPIQAVVVIYLLWTDLGVSSLAGLVVIIIAMTIQSCVGRQFGRIRAKMSVLTDQRIRIMNEVLTAMKIIKMYAWEKPFEKLVSETRRKEVQKVLYSAILKACNFSMMFISSRLLNLFTFITFVMLGGHLTPSKVFSAIALYNVLRTSMGLFFPLAIEKLSESLISLKRIQNFLMLDEIDDDLQGLPPKSSKDCIVELTSFTAWWTEDEDSANRPTLEDITLNVKPGQLLAVIGPVGSGKSSFLSAILRELPASTGQARVVGQVSYAGQTPWVFSGSIRDNILFGEEYNEKRFKEVIDVCCLEKDLLSFEFGDLTLVGQRGVTLSGGQKARVNLARAVYRRGTNIFLMDDPLSAVDASVAHKMFEHCICRYLRKTIRILVTHQLQFIQKADQIMILKEGKIAGLGTYSELQADGTDFAALLKKKEEPPLSPGPGGFRNRLLSGERQRTYSFMEDNLQLKSDVNLAMLPDAALSQGDIFMEEIYESTFTLNESKLQIPCDINGVSADDSSCLTGNETIQPLIAEDKADFVAPVEEEEINAQGSVKFQVYKNYFIYNVYFFTLLTILALSDHTVFILCDWWIAVWATRSEIFYSQMIISPLNTTFASPTSLFNSSASGIFNTTTTTAIPALKFNDEFYIIVYAGLIALLTVLLYTRSIAQFYYCVKSGILMHDKMFHAIIHAPMRFFDVNPVGRILNRFSKDLGQIDELLPQTFMDFIYIFCMIFSILILSVTINYFVIVIVIPLSIYFIWLRQYYIKTSRDIKRMEGASRSPVFTHVSNTIQGLSTVRAFNMQDKFEEEFNNRQDLHSSAWFLFITGSRWLAVRLDAICAIFIGCVAYFSILTSSINAVDAGKVGLTLTYAIMLMGMFQWGTRQSAEVENLMTSVERIQQYYAIEPEAPHEVDGSSLPRGWPQYGIVTFDNLSYAHYKGGPDILHDIRANIRAHEKVGIVGRTGAGKSSLISTLFRLNEYSKGSVMIDGINVSELGLTDLRSAISIIPQDPILFAGSMRKNLDPFQLYTDDEVWTALEQVQLKPVVEQLPLRLSTELAESGSNFSVGQRQLVCLARAVLRKNRVLIIDEATANVDLRTDFLIQETIRNSFKHCTVLTIAHRLHTIIDSDRVMVLDQGRLIEFDEPHVLLGNEDGIFTQMVDATGRSEAKALRQIAAKAHSVTHDNNTSPENGVPDHRRSFLSRYLPVPGSYDHLEIETNM